MQNVKIMTVVTPVCVRKAMRSSPMSSHVRGLNANLAILGVMDVSTKTNAFQNIHVLRGANVSILSDLILANA